jgi:hypothetical protein
MMMQRIVIALVSAAVLAPAAFADSPAPAAAQLKNAAKTCKALKAKPESEQTAALGKTFAQAYGTRSNAHGKCVSDQARKLAAAAAQAAEQAAVEAARQNASTTCKAWATDAAAVQTALEGKTFADVYGKGNNAYGKCVSAQARAGVDAVVNAARTCKGWSKATVDAQKAALEGKTFAERFGTAANAYGKCVSAQSK